MAEKPLTLTNNEIVSVLSGLIALDGFAKKEGSVEHYEFDENLSWNLAKLRRIFEDAKKTYDMALKTLAMTHKIVEGQRVTDENCERVAKFIEARERLGAKTQELTGILRISRKELQRAGVRVPGILAALFQILTDA